MTTDARPPSDDAEELDGEPAEQRSRAGLWLALAVVAVLVLPATLIAASLFSSDPEPEQLTIRVPAGTGDRIDAGEEVQLMPERVELNVGDRMLVINDDDRVHYVGPFTVRPGESILQVFGEPGRFEGECTLIPSKRVEIIVT